MHPWVVRVGNVLLYIVIDSVRIGKRVEARQLRNSLATVEQDVYYWAIAALFSCPNYIR